MDVETDPDRLVAGLADAQQGVLRRQQLLDSGLSRTAIADRVARRRLRELYRGVYALGHAELRREGNWLAAVWGCGKRAVLSHHAAAALWDLLPVRGALIDVSTPSRSGRDPDQTRVRIHRVGTLRAWECTRTEGIPATTVARTLLDLSPRLRPRAMEDVIGRADRLGLFDLVAVRRCLGEHPRQHGAPALRRLLDELRGTGPADLRSDLEVRLLQLFDDHHLPRPLTNVNVAGILVDFHWPESNVIVETDGYAYHSSRGAFERDRERDQQLALAGYVVVRFTYKQVMETPEAVVNRVRRLLQRCGSLRTS